MYEIIRQYRSLFIAEGILFIILGVLAVALPGLFTLGTELLVGVLFVIAGIAQAFRMFQAKGFPGFLFTFLIALLYFAVGVILLANPLQGVLTLTILLTIFFFVEGIAQIILAFQFRPYGVWGWRLLSGLISLLLAYLIWSGWPGSAIWVIGLLVGVNLIFTGFTQLFLALSVPK